MIEFKINLEQIQELLNGKKLVFNNQVTIHPPQEGFFITREKFDKILANETQIVNKLLAMMAGSKKK